MKNFSIKIFKISKVTKKNVENAIMQQIKELVDLYTEVNVENQHEIEFRLGELQNGTFISGVTRLDMENLAHKLDEFQQQNPTVILSVSESQFEDVQERGCRRRTFLSKKDHIVEQIVKKRIAYCDFRVLQRKYDCRLSLKHEVPITMAAQATNTLNSSNTTINKRFQHRKSYYTYDGCRIDLSRIESYAPSAIAASSNNSSTSTSSSSSSSSSSSLSRPDTTITYEVEIEWLNQKMMSDESEATDDEKTKQIASAILKWAVFVQNCFTSPKICDASDSFLHFVHLHEPKSQPKPQSQSPQQQQQQHEGSMTDFLFVGTTRSICLKNEKEGFK